MSPLEQLDQQLTTESLLWSTLHRHGRDRRLEKQTLDEIDRLLDQRLEITNAGSNQEESEQPGVDS